MRNSLRDPLLIQAIIAAALSFAHIHDIAEAAGQGGWKAWAYPVSVDLLLVMAWKQIREAAEGESKRAPWVWFLLSMAASIGANVGTAGVLDLTHPPVLLRVMVAGWPVLAFFGGSLLVHSRKSPTEEPQEPTGAPNADPTDEEPAEPVNAAPRPHLVSYAEAAAKLGVAPETIRGAANGKSPRLTKYSGTAPNSVRVDLNEARMVINNRRPVAP
jgi:hypothetical protein